MNIELNYYEIIKDYLKNNKVLNTELVKKHMISGCCCNELIDEMEMIGIDLNEDDKKKIKSSHQLLQDSEILLDNKYDDYLIEWLGSDFTWKLLYRSSEHGYTTSSFHKYCDNKGPTLTIIKSKAGWIFGGYTSKSWDRTCILLLNIM